MMVGSTVSWNFPSVPCGIPRATVFFYAHDAARAADRKAEGSHAFNGFWIKALFNVPHAVIKTKESQFVCKVAPRRMIRSACGVFTLLISDASHRG